MPGKRNENIPARACLIKVACWVAQAIVALSFIAGAYMKILTPIPDLSVIWPWTGALPPIAVRALGFIDLAGGVGIVLPTLTGIKPRLTGFAALGCVLLQISAIIFHLSRGEAAVLPVNIMLLALSAVVLWLRWPRKRG
jgi:hypothetical protein